MYTPFVNAYIVHVCPIRPTTCMQRLHVPSLPKQILICDRIKHLEHADITGQVMIAMLDDNEDLADSLIDASDVYYASLSYLRAATDTMKDDVVTQHV